MLNSLGVGFALSLADEGFTKGFGMASKAVDSFGTGISTATSFITGIAQDFKITTTNTEAWGVMANKASSQVLAGLNMTDKQLAKSKGLISSVAFDMNTDVGTVSQSFKALAQSGVDVTKIGFKSFSEFQKFMSVTGTDSTKFAATIAKMRAQFHFTDKQIADTLTTVVALGKRFNMGSEAATLMSNTVGVLAEEGATLFAELGPDKTKKFLEGTQELAIAFQNAGHSADEAQKLALGVGRAMFKGRQGVQSLYTGLAEDLPDAVSTLTENFGDFNQAFEMLQKDPAKFTKSLAMVAQKIQQNSKSQLEAQQRLARFGGELQKSFGPEFVSLIGGSLDKTVESFKAVDKELSKPGGLANKNGVLGQMAGQWSDGRTAAERFSWSIDRFRTHLKKFMTETDDKALNRFTNSFGKAEDKIGELVQKGGVLGKATQMMIEFQNHGIGGVASKISEDWGPAAAILIQDFGPIISKFATLTPLIGMLLNPFTILIGLVVGVGEYFREAADGGGAFHDMIDELMPTITKYAKVAWDTFVMIWHKIPWGAIWKDVKIGFDMLVDLIRPYGARAIDAIKQGAINWISDHPFAAAFALMMFGGLPGLAFGIGLAIGIELYKGVKGLMSKVSWEDILDTRRAADSMSNLFTTINKVAYTSISGIKNKAFIAFDLYNEKVKDGTATMKDYWEAFKTAAYTDLDAAKDYTIKTLDAVARHAKEGKLTWAEYWDAMNGVAKADIKFDNKTSPMVNAAGFELGEGTVAPTVAAASPSKVSTAAKSAVAAKPSNKPDSNAQPAAHASAVHATNASLRDILDELKSEHDDMKKRMDLLIQVTAAGKNLKGRRDLVDVGETLGGVGE